MFSQRKKRMMASRLTPFTPPRPPSAKAVLNSQELKYCDTQITTTIDATTEVINSSLNIIPQGDTASSRDGNIVEVKSIEITGRLAFVPAAAATASTIVCIWVVLDRQPNGAAMSATGASTSYLTSIDGAATSMLPLPPNQWRFKTIAKFVIPLMATAGVTTAYNNSSAPITLYKKFKKPIQIRMIANGGTIADISTNNFAIVAGASDSDDLVSFTGQTRLRYTG